MKRQFPLVIVGNTLAGMVAATKMARAGAEVAVVHGGRGWGGHFSTLMCNGASYDLGMVLYEFTSFNCRGVDEDVATYDPGVRNDVGRFCGVVQRYVANYQNTREIETPELYVDGRPHPDLLISNALHSLKRLNFASDIRADLAALLSRPGRSALHASRKRTADDFKASDYHTASLENHGTTLHEKLIEPFCRKLLNCDTRNVLALYHRAAWLPLFYPETLLSYLDDAPQNLPPTIFSYPLQGGVGGLTQQLRDEMAQSAEIALLESPVERMSQQDDGSFLLLSGGDAIRAECVAWGNSLGEARRTLGLEAAPEACEKCSIALAFARVPARAVQRDFTVLSIVDPEFAVYRITNQSRCAGESGADARLTIELNPDYATSLDGMESYNGADDAAVLSRRVKRELLLLGVVQSETDIAFIETRKMNGALMLPTASNRALMMSELEIVRGAAPNLHLMGPASGFFSSSLNDQIVQGLKLARFMERAS